MTKCALTSNKCPYNFSEPAAADMARDNCPIGSYEREDNYTPTNQKGQRQIDDSCHWLK